MSMFFWGSFLYKKFFHVLNFTGTVAGKYIDETVPI